ncbi:MAG TPA: hypothetical protein VK283_14685, partial [Acidimicrobiales bacterium]|nr:hypothetical protein [Acidimicrobiales bacterium]
ARIALANSDGGGVTGGIYLALEATGNQPSAPTTITGSNLIPATPTASGSTSSGTNLASPAHSGTSSTGSSSTSTGSTGGGKYEPTP